jgi:phospholipid/cholesterol/gamma-HCH transport system substrate-binding protein
MDENKLKFGVGVLVVSAIGISIILVFLFGAIPNLFNSEYAIITDFPSAEGIAVNSPVLRDGVRIGRISSIELREEGGVRVTLAIDSEYPMTHRYIPQIGIGNFVTGDAKLEFILADEKQLAAIPFENQEIISKPYTDGEYVNYGAKTLGLLEMQDDLQATFRSIQTAGESIAAAGENVNQLVTEVREILVGTATVRAAAPDAAQSSGGQLRLASQVIVAGDQGLAGEIRETLEEFQAVMRDVRVVTGSPQNQQSIESALSQLPRVLSNIERTLQSSESVFQTIDRAGTQIERVGVAAEEAVGNINNTAVSADKMIRNLEQFTEPLAARGDELVDQAIRSLANLEQSLVQVEQFGRTLNNSDGTLKRFLEDDDIYWQVKRSVENVEMATARIRPILDDVRVFTDKIARDPRELGVRGAISKRPTGMGLK